MDPTGGFAGKGLIALIVAIVLLWIFAPWEVAAGVSGFFAFVLFILANARDT